MIVLFTDFGADDIYVGQLKAALLDRLAASTLVVDLLHSVPNHHVRAGAHLLAALQSRFPAGAVFVAVVDPGVGTSRDAVVLQADDKWYAGPDNGLLSVVSARAARTRTWRIVWRPPAMSASFHGRDLFAPVAASIASGNLPADELQEIDGLNVQLGPEDLAEVIYIDHYGNALTGLRAKALARTASIAARGHRVPYARVFADAPKSSAFWYENSIGLVELAVSRANAAAMLGIEVGDPVTIVA
ncbi:MAG TPA: SAM-dependent chlorinase/fluorinase [Casimicrobiaceae bacterium]|nr:SAM-dependent chlorinase/fluorinase [Casimicrobiaceae bacterium]